VSLKRDLTLQLLFKVDWNLLQSSAHCCREAGGKVAHAATGGNVFLDQPEKRRKRRIAVLRLRIVDRHPLVFDAKGNPAAVIDAKRLAYRLGTVVCPLAVIVLVSSMIVAITVPS